MVALVPLINAGVNLAIAAYLFTWYRRERGHPGIFVAWIVAFLSYAASNVLSYFLFTLDATVKIFPVIRAFRFLCFAIALTLLYWGAIRFISHRPFWRNLLPLLYFFGATLVTIYYVGFLGTPPAFTFVVAFGFMLPMELFLAVLFLFLYGILLGEHLHRVSGPLWIALALLTLSAESVTLPFIVNTPTFQYWFFLRLASIILMFVGLVRLRVESEAYLRTLGHTHTRYVSPKTLR